MRKIIFSLVVTTVLAGGVGVLAQSDNLLPSGITPDSPFYFFKTLKESIQTFFTFGAENKAKQFLHLADVRLAEYQKMLEKGKTDLAQKTLDKYEKQLSRAIQKVEELKNKGKDVKDVSERIASTTAKHIEVLEDNLQKVPENAKQGIERALKNIQKIKSADETANWRTYRNEKYGVESRYPNSWILDDKEALSIYLPDQTKNFIQINISNGVTGRNDESMSPCQPGIAGAVYQVGKLRDSRQTFEDFVDFKIENPERGLPPIAKPKLISTAVGEHKALKV